MHDIPKQIPLANNHISVDCVVIGFDGEQLKVLLINRIGEENGKVYRDMKLPGSLIYMDEDLDEAAQRVQKPDEQSQRCTLVGTGYAIESGTHSHHSLSVDGKDRSGTGQESG